MDIFDYAMKMERDGERFYREMAAECGDKGLALILNMMADAEVQHFEVLKQMKDDVDPTLSDTLLLNNVKNVFEAMEDREDFDLNAEQVALYEQARGIEKRSEDFYRGKAQEVKSIPHRQILEQIATEERQHYKLLGHLIEFVTKPGKWMEDAEWHHLDEY